MTRAPLAPLATGQTKCYDTSGEVIPCAETGQDGEYTNGVNWPEPRFTLHEDIVLDHLTGLYWTGNANLSVFPMCWQESLDFISRMNQENALGYNDWRLPNRRELRSLMSYQTRLPALPDGHPFCDVFSGWYWSSTTAVINPEHAWYVHMEGARMFYGGKDQSYLAWPVRGESQVLYQTGQTDCYDASGHSLGCATTRQDGEIRAGVEWPSPRFVNQDEQIIDKATGLIWRKNASLTARAVTWDKALQAVKQLNQSGSQNDPPSLWRLPNINELESLVDCSQHSPALAIDMTCFDLQPGYWSSTTSAFEPDWAWALYLAKGALGIGQKKDPHFYVWAVKDDHG
jgi:hypothetical protein